MTRRVVTAAAIVGALAVGACGRASEAPAKAPAQTALPVTVAVAETTPLSEGLEAGGVVRASTSATVSARVMATVLERRVRAGDRVRAGQVLVVLDDRDLAAHVRQADAAAGGAEQGLAAARSEVAAAAAEQKLAEAWHARISTLRGQNSATVQELDEAEARLAGARARVDAARARVEQATSGLTAARAAGEAASTTRSFSSVTAPFDGLVTETMVEPGSLAMPGMPLVRVDAGGGQEIEAQVDEARVPYVRVGDEVRVQLDSTTADTPPVALTGRVKEVARAVQADARAFTVKVSVPATDLRAGSFARVRFSGASRPALTVPLAAVRRQGQVVTAFVVDAGVARLRLLQTGRVDGDLVEVLAGLDAGERVVAPPPLQLTDGSPVSITPDAGAGGVR